MQIRIEPSGDNYTVSKPLLCGESEYFRAMLEGGFVEGGQKTVAMKEIDGVVSARSMEALLQWLYLRRVRFETAAAGEKMEAAIEVARLADMVEMGGLERYMGEYIKEVLVTPKDEWGLWGGAGALVTLQHIEAASLLPQGHEVGRILGRAMVGEYACQKGHRFRGKMAEYPRFAANVLEAMVELLGKVEFGKNQGSYKDPLTGNKITMRRFQE